MIFKRAFCVTMTILSIQWHKKYIPIVQNFTFILVSNERKNKQIIAKIIIREQRTHLK